MHVGAELALSISGEILTHLEKKNIFLAQKLTELEHFLLIFQIFNGKSLKYGPKMFRTISWLSGMSFNHHTL